MDFALLKRGKKVEKAYKAFEREQSIQHSVGKKHKGKSQRRIYQDECGICHQIKTIAIKKDGNGFICYTCYHKEILQEECSLCHQVARIALRTADKKAVCPNCYRTKIHLEKCSICQQVKEIAIRTGENKTICNACYQRTIHLEECIFCHRVKSVVIRKEDKAVCPACYQGIHRQECDICHLIKSVAVRTAKDKAICHTCYHQMKRREQLIKWFLGLSLNEVANFVVETSYRKDKVSLRKLDIFLEYEEGQKRLREALMVISQAVAAKRIVAGFLGTDKGKSLRALLK